MVASRLPNHPVFKLLLLFLNFHQSQSFYFFYFFWSVFKELENRLICVRNNSGQLFCLLPDLPTLLISSIIIVILLNISRSSLFLFIVFLFRGLNGKFLEGICVSIQLTPPYQKPEMHQTRFLEVCSQHFLQFFLWHKTWL